MYYNLNEIKLKNQRNKLQTGRYTILEIKKKSDMGQENIVEVENNFNSIIGKRYLEGNMTPYMLNFRR